VSAVTSPSSSARTETPRTGPTADLDEIERRLEMPLVTAVATQRAVRRVHSDPLPDELILRLVELAIEALLDRTGRIGSSSPSPIPRSRRLSRPNTGGRGALRRSCGGSYGLTISEIAC
jgi:hypothetical protein